ncbi:MAG: (Fe-S)-binding protein [Proteobacteria bacterium]|nr:(Fe-S)-binding protein [Pseudomonadota bacterium]MBU1542432.1 (Fe-S)-binding protein [Pseudomonadota bacterium]MBU2482808.1 (Fe-S)-binding protein [Pseudomonadota bacterium]
MINSQNIINQFADHCTACGCCVEVCPIVGDTALKDAAPESIMEEVLTLFNDGTIGPLARTRIYSCLFCNACLSACPEALNPGLTFGTSKGLLQQLGDIPPKGVATIMSFGKTLLDGAIPSFRKRLKSQEKLITSFTNDKPKPVKTVLFASCFGLIEGSVLHTALKLLERIDPDVCILGGYDFCCGEFQFMAGQPDAAQQQFDKMISGLNALAPEQVVMFCPTCKMTFDHHQPATEWSWSFITDFVARHLDQLGPFQKIDKIVTIHDPCHFVRGVEPATDSPRKILEAIPGIQVIEMEKSGDDALCCGAYAITGTGKPGYQFRNRRLAQAKGTGADILSLYCPGCHMTLGSEGANISLQVESILSLLGKSLGIA